MTYGNLDVFFSGLDNTEILFALPTGTRIVRGYFDNAFFDSSVGEVVLDSTQPRFQCKESDVAGIPRETACKVEGKDFTVMEIQADGTGLATVTLAHE
jgi:hypothetical protein